MDDQEIIAGLIKQDRRAYDRLYKLYYPVIERYVLQNSGSADDARDIFQDAMIIIFEKAGRSQLVLTASLKSYLYAICRNLWLKKLRSGKALIHPDPSETVESAEQQIINLENKESTLKKLSRAFLAMTAHCKRLLNSIFYKRKTLDAIATENGYKNIHTAQNQKYKCLEQARSAFQK